MNLISLENISKNYSEKTLLNNISLGINEGEKIGLIGVGIVAVISIYLYISSRVKKSYREEKEKMKK